MRRLPLLSIIGLVLLTACTDDGARTLGPVPTAPPTSTTTSTVAVTTTAPPSTTRPAPATTTTAGPRLVNGIPQVTATPAQAPVGGRVRIEGTGFTDAMWRAADAPLWLLDPGGCPFYAQATHSVTVSAEGRLSGELTVPSTGGCRMSDEPRAVTGGQYRIVFACTPCIIGEMEVTSSAGRCRDVAFSPNSDNLASDIVATGTTCAEAQSLVGKVGPQTGPINGAARVEADGYVCVRTAQSDRGLPNADYVCTSGAKTVTFHRT